MTNDRVTRSPVVYKWRYDGEYLSTTIARYYKQLPVVFHPPVQFTLAWLVCVLAYWETTGAALKDFAGWALLIGFIVIPGGSAVSKQGILFKYRVRRSFGTEALYSMTEAGVSYSGVSQEASYPWTTYTRGVRFPDGILLLRRGAMRWLPDRALQQGTPAQATDLVRSHIRLRLIE